MAMRIENGEERDVMKSAITQFKYIISQVVPQVAEADISIVSHSNSDPTCLALRPMTEEREEMLEEIMPLDDIPSGSMVTMTVEEISHLWTPNGTCCGSYLKI